jgi:hypothetical protein
MAVAIWIWEPDYAVGYEREFDETILPMGPGHDIVVSRDIAHTRASGIGTVASYRGCNVFSLEFGRKNYDGPTEASREYRAMLTFLQARKDTGTPFYFYNVLENSVPATWTGDTEASGTDLAGNAVTNLTGRYLVRHFGPIPWSLVSRKFTSFTLEFHETFEVPPA